MYHSTLSSKVYQGKVNSQAMNFKFQHENEDRTEKKLQAVLEDILLQIE